MVDQGSSESSSSSSSSEEGSDLVELKIKTLDSQIFSFQVEKDMPVSLFKEKVANDIGVPVGQQRLIFRGKLLKDDHLLSEYHVENGHTLHLVERQPSESQTSTDASAWETNGSSAQGNDANTGTPRNHDGQISHSVVLGTFNVGDQSEGVVPDLTRVIGAVLNSFGVAGQPLVNATNTTRSSPLAHQGNEADVMQAGNQTQSTQPSPVQPFQFSPHILQIPLAAATSLPLASLNSPIPDSLNTLLEYMNRMERVLSQNGYLQNMSLTDTSDLPRVELPSDTRGLPSPEALVIVMRHAEQLLSTHAIAALLHIAGRLEQERDSSDPSVRGQMQTELVQVGLAMQHFGALLLELGRTILSLHVGESPLESSLNAGPAVYISQSGPNPIMVQPFPPQTSSLFTGANPPSNPITLGPVGIGGAPRQINIHIHAGTSLAPVVSALGNRTSNGEGIQGEHDATAGPVASSSMRVSPARNVIGAPMPLRPAAISSTLQPNAGVSASQALSELSLSSLLAELNYRVRNLAGNVQGENQVASGNVGNAQPNYISRALDPGTTLSGFIPVSEGLKDPLTRTGGGSSSSRRESIQKARNPSGSALRFSDDSGNAAPLGLGMGGLERKRGGVRHTKSSVRSEHNMSVLDRDLNASISQQLLQSLAARSSSMNRMDAVATSSSGLAVGSVRSSRGQGAADQFDAASAVSQLLENPALMNSLLGGVSDQAGLGSPDMLGNMLQQLAQNPQIMNTVGQFAQQVDGQELGSMFSKLKAGQGVGMDLAQMVQQMMPVVSQALDRGPNASRPQSNRQYEGRRSSAADKYNDDHFQVGIQQVAQSVGQFNSPVDVFHTVVESAVQLLDDETCAEDLLDELCSDEGLANDYARILQRDIRRRFQDIP